MARHVISAERKIDEGEGRREILLPAALRCGVMPAVEYGTGNQVFERA